MIAVVRFVLDPDRSRIVHDLANLRAECQIDRSDTDLRGIKRVDPNAAGVEFLKDHITGQDRHPP